MILFFFVAFGILLLLYTSPHGLGLNDDSIAYIAGARSLLSGNGYREAWLISNGPVVHFPPGFPVALAFISFVTGIDPVRSARVLNGLLFGLNIALTGWLAWRMTNSRVAGISSAAVVLLNTSLLYIHTQAMSEPLYISLMLISFLLIDQYFKRKQTYYLILLGIILGWAYLARYAALSSLATILALMLVLHSDWRKRVSSFLVVAISSLPWIIGWSIRNRIVGGTYANRVIGWHPITTQNWMLAVETLSEFLVPVSAWRRAIPVTIFIVILLLIGLSILLWTLYKGLPRLFKPSQVSMPEVFPLTNSLHIVAYLLALVITMTLFDPATKFQVRILSPIYISIIFLIAALATWIWQKKNTVWKTTIILGTIAILNMFSYGLIQNLPELRNSPGFANPSWKYSKIITALKEFPPTALILTNEPGLVYLHTGRPSGVLPRPGTDLTKIKQSVLDGDIVIALFRVNRADNDLLAYYSELGYGLYRTDFSRSWILSAFPEQETK